MFMHIDCRKLEHTRLDHYKFPCNIDLRMSVALVLAGRIEEALYTLAVVCSTWSVVNAGTSKRDLLTPLGDIRIPGVRCANRMVARTLSFGIRGCLMFSFVFSKMYLDILRLLVYPTNSCSNGYPMLPLLPAG